MYIRSIFAGALLAKGQLGMRRRMSAADEPGARGVKQLRFGRYGDRPGVRHLPPRSLAHLTRPISEAKWVEARGLGGG